MIKPEIDLELSIKALEVYPIEPAIIKSMLSNLQKVVKQNCNKHDVIPRFSKEQLHISRGARTLNIKGFDGLKKEPTATITCIEQWDNDGDGLYDETEDNQWATFYLRVEDIDPIITKLLEIKGFLNGV